MLRKIKTKNILNNNLRGDFINLPVDIGKEYVFIIYYKMLGCSWVGKFHRETLAQSDCVD